MPTGAPAVDENYSRLLAQNYPHSGRPVDAVALYRRLLTAQPDHSVTIVAIGGLTNPAQLIRTDRALVARKVLRTVIMDGEYPQAITPGELQSRSRRYRQVIANWPGPTGVRRVRGRLADFAGNNVCTTHPSDSPVRAAFDQLYR